MRVVLFRKNNIKNIDLPKNPLGSFCVVDNKINIINIEAMNGEWFLVNNDEYYCNGFEKEKYVKLEEYSFYCIINNSKTNSVLLYCMPKYETNVKYYGLSSYKNKLISVGKDANCDIAYGLNNLTDIEFKFSYSGDGLFINGLNPNNNVFLNNSKLYQDRKLSIGDILFIYGLKIIVTEYNGEYYLIINNPKFLNNKLSESTKPNTISENQIIDDNDEIELNEEDEEKYFNRNPRFRYSIEPLKLELEVPNEDKNKNDLPIILTVGPMLTMSLTSVSMLLFTISNTRNGELSFLRLLPSIFMMVGMIGGTLIWPLIIKKYQARKNKKELDKKKAKYSLYIDEQIKTLNESRKAQMAVLNNNFPSLGDCNNVILNSQTNLWERRLGDDDFLKVSLGIGDCPMELELKMPKSDINGSDGEFRAELDRVNKELKILENVPITLSLLDNNISAIYGDEKLANRLVQNMLLQIIAFHSYDDLKIVVLTNEDNALNWEFAKTLPHCWNNDRLIRYFGTNNDDYKEIFYDLEKIVTKRTEKEVTKEDYNCHYLIVTDSFSEIRNYDFIKNVLEDKELFGFSLLILNDKIANLPDQCQAFVGVDPKGTELFYTNQIMNRSKVSVDVSTYYDLYECAKKLSNILIEIDDEEGMLPDKIGFLELYDVGKVEQLNVLNRWENNVPILNIQAPVGVGKNNEIISLDLHEKFHGPHGLIGGMTGSGKSEFIITYILSMAVNYHPNEVQFVLIDYKGGGLAGAFENSVTGVKLPHLVGTVTNLDVNEINRALVSINSELRRRQMLFNKAREKSSESTIDIYKYQKMYRDGKVDEPISHLFIICDEFAELKQNQPEFLDELISTARIGRSLGVHLILATQKPSGVVSPQIWSNSRFRVCLRVQEKSDSTEMIDRPDAAYITKTGRFYLQVGNNELFLFGQSAWSGKKYLPVERIKKQVDNSISIINNIGYSYKNIETKIEEAVDNTDNGEELTNVLKYLNFIAAEQNISCKQLWLDMIPKVIYVDDLIKKYNYKKEKYKLNPVIGEYDDPYNQNQDILTLPFTEKGNLILYGMSGSGKENLLLSMIYSTMLTEDPSTLNYYIVDFGAEVFRCVANCPLVGDIVYQTEEEKIVNLFKKIRDMIAERKKLFNDYNGNYYDYSVTTGNQIPQVVVILNNYELFCEMYLKYEDDLIALSRESAKYGIYFVITVNSYSGGKYKLKQNFSQTILLQLVNSDDYSMILNTRVKIYPAKVFGRGLVVLNDEIYEIQSAYATEKDNISNYLKSLSLDLSKKYNTRASKIPSLPEVVTYNDVKEEFNKDNKLIVGISKDKFEIEKYNPIKLKYSLILSSDLESMHVMVNQLINQIAATDRFNLTVVNLEEFEIDEKTTKNYAYFDKTDASLTDKLKEQSEKEKLVIVIGISKLKAYLTGASEFANVFTDNSPNSYIIVDIPNKARDIMMDAPFRNFDMASNGIWIGSGFDGQFVLKSQDRITNIPNDYCIVLSGGKPKIVKYVADFKVGTEKEPDEDSESVI